MNHKTITLLVAGLFAVGVTAAGIAVAAVLLTQHFTARKDHEVAYVTIPPDQNLPDQNPRPNGPRRADSRPGDRGNFQRRGGGGNFQGGPGGGMMMLSDDQRQLLQDAQQESNDKLRELEEKFRAAQKETVDAALAAAPDQKAILGKAEAMAAIQVEMTVLRAKGLSALVPSLQPDQRRQMTDSPFGAMLLSGGGGGGGRGGPGFGGPGGGGFGPGGFGGGARPGGGPDDPGPRPDH